MGNRLEKLKEERHKLLKQIKDIAIKIKPITKEINDLQGGVGRDKELYILCTKKQTAFMILNLLEKGTERNEIKRNLELSEGQYNHLRGWAIYHREKKALGGAKI